MKLSIHPLIHRFAARQLRAVFALCAALMVPGAAWAWGAGGHMMVAQIAEQRLTPAARAQVVMLLQVKLDPAVLSTKTRDMVNAAHWADDLRPVEAYSFAKPLHFVDNPFSTDGTDVPEDLPESANILSALDTYVGVLKAADSTDAERAEALRFVIHFVGDAHQPLHCATRVSGKLPEGDHGGNAFTIKTAAANGKKKATKLHSYWDGGAGAFPREGANFAPPSLASVSKAAADAVAAYPEDSEAWNRAGLYDYSAWSDESEKIAETFVYKGLVANAAPKPAYVKKAQQITQQRVAWAGYRLAALLNDILK